MNVKPPLVVVSMILFTNCLSAQQKGTYKDNFRYLASPGTADSNSFNNWFWETYPQPGGWANITPVDQWASFQFRIPANDKKNPTAICSQLTIKGNAPAAGNLNVNGQDAEIFNNDCITGANSGTYMQPPCNTSFPNGRLKNVQPPYQMSTSSAEQGSMFLSPYSNGKNTPYYPSDSVPYCIKMRVKADGQTYGTRGWGFWNTVMPQGSHPDYFAWFWEFGIHLDGDSSTDNTKLPLVFPMVITSNGQSIQATIIWVDIYQWHDYKIVWSKDTVDYYVDDNIVATHCIAPPADVNGAMAYHCWVDNRLFYAKPTANYKYIILPQDKTNSMEYFEAKPLNGYKRPRYLCSTMTESENSGDLGKLLTKVKDAYLKELKKRNVKK